MSNLASRVDELTAKLTLEEKVSLLTGRDFWNTVPLESIGLRNLLLSDGPSGVRGEFWDERDNSLNLPSATALGSSWSHDLAAEYGRTLAREAARKGVDVVLGPTINLHRSPLGGRHFECLSEDPMLTGALAVSYTKAMQSLGKGACPKHYVANDFETERYTVDVVVDERSLRELYLRPFEDAVVDGGAWTIMSSYNQINGTTATEHDLLETPLRTEWGFDGVVISDWTAVRSLESAKAEQDLVMPGPIGPWGEALVSAVRSGEIEESTIDRKIKRMILLAVRVGAIGGNGETPAQPSRHNNIAAEGRSFARRAASEGAVLLENDGILPISDLSRKAKVALIGHNAKAARTQGGGSATTLPEFVVTPLDALQELLGDKLSYSVGAVVQRGIGEINKASLKNPVTNGAGVHVEFLDASGNVIYTEERLASTLTWLGSQAPVETAASIHLRTKYTPAVSESALFGFASVQPVSISVDGQVVIQDKLTPETEDVFTALMDPPFASTNFEFVAGRAVEIDIHVDLANREGLALSAQNFVFGFETDRSNEQRLIDEAVAEAKSAELAIVVVGTNAQVESEGFDRKDIKLPGRQDELVSAVVAANPNTIVIVNSGSPVLMPWRKDVKAVLVSYFGGEQMGNALVDMLTGATEPGGRLPTTWPADEASIPVLNCTPDSNGQVIYEEGIHIGYRAWLKAGAVPAYDFGYGLGYTTWQVSAVTGGSAISANESVELEVEVKNTGSRAGKHIVQVYAERKESAIDRPVRWLVGFAEVHAGAGETKTASISIRGREFADWNKGWNHEAGEFTLLIGSNVNDLPVSHAVRMG
jgi:beta-glucosidase